MAQRMQIPSVEELRAAAAEPLTADQLDRLRRLCTARIHGHGNERLPLFVLSGGARLLRGAIEGVDDEERLAEASRRFAPAADAALEAIESGAAPEAMYAHLDHLVEMSAAANRSLVFGEGTSSARSPHG
jgi:hypothetical protein